MKTYNMKLRKVGGGRIAENYESSAPTEGEHLPENSLLARTIKKEGMKIIEGGRDSVEITVKIE
ncbi:hypothetical protein CMI48_04495 [Candidatus Pacearchaeota archaeon]|nr:hypothetical protein [Candidatus Pacearchaeota archaeon]